MLIRYVITHLSVSASAYRPSSYMWPLVSIFVLLTMWNNPVHPFWKGGKASESNPHIKPKIVGLEFKMVKKISSNAYSRK